VESFGTQSFAGHGARSDDEIPRRQTRCPLSSDYIRV
jgi:hypothetical protein